MGFYPPDALVHEARRRGVRVAGPDVNRSEVLCHVESPRRRGESRPASSQAVPAWGPEVQGGLVVRVGLGYVKGVREEEMRALVDERERGGPYRGVADLASRSGASRDGLERLAWAGALDGLVGGAEAETAPPPGGAHARRPTAPQRSPSGRRAALWEAGIAAAGVRHGEGTQMALPLEAAGAPRLAPLGSWGEAIADYRSIGMTLGEHPMALMRAELGPEVARSADLGRLPDRVTVEVAGMVVARQRPETANGVVFILLEDERGTVNLVVPPPVYERRRALVRTAPLLRARGRLERAEGTVNVVVSELRPLERAALRPPGAGSPRRPGGARSAPGSPPPQAHRARERAIAELRAVAPSGHSFGRRGR